jgi:hypothetical protein
MKCPTCKSAEMVRAILYGEPASPIDEGKYIIGGAMMEEGSPDYRCLTCGWEQQNEISAILGSFIGGGTMVYKEVIPASELDRD